MIFLLASLGIPKGVHNIPISTQILIHTHTNTHTKGSQALCLLVLMSESENDHLPKMEYSFMKPERRN